MQEDINKLYETILTIHKNNLTFLKQNHIKVFEKVNNLSIDIENSEYQEKYSLEYKKEEGYFDILDIETKQYLYGYNSYIEADERVKRVDFSTKHSLNLLRINSETNKLALLNSLEENIPLVNYINNNIDLTNITFSKIYKFIFIGVGLGVHLHEIYKKLNPMNTLVIEPNLEIFRLSLFLIDYSEFEKGNRTLFLSIGESKAELNNTIYKFYSVHKYMNYNIKHHLFQPKNKEILDNIIDFFADNDPLGFSYHSVLKVFKRTINFMQNDYKFITKKLLKEINPLNDQKVLLISAGPSLDNHLKWIKDNQNKFVIICVDVILRKLEKNGIIPDIVVSIDPSYLCAKYLTTKDKNFLKESAIIFLSQQHNDTINTVKNFHFYFSQVLNISEKLGYSVSLPNVGTFSFFISVILGGKELYLIGNDAAFNQETGSRYAKDSSHTMTENINLNYEKNLISRKDLLEVKGNFREKIKSTRELLEFRNTYEETIHNLKDIHFKVFNLSDGAYIDGMIPLKAEDINTKDIKDKDFNPINYLESITTTVDDLEFGNDIKILNSIILRVKNFNKKKYKTIDTFLSEKIDFMIWILEQKKLMHTQSFGNIFLKFLEVIDIYINFTLNLKQLNLSHQNHLSTINQHWCNSLLLLLKEMKESIKK